MPLIETLVEYLRAAFSGIYLETFEPDEALREIHELCLRENWQLATWDIDRGLALSEQGTIAPGTTDPLAAIRSLPAMATPGGTAILVLKNFHRFLNSAEIVQALQNQLNAGKSTRAFVLILAPTIQLPAELERQFVILHHDLPSRGQLRVIARELVSDEPTAIQDADDDRALLDAAVGLTRHEAEAAYALSLARYGELRPDAVWEIKAQSLKKQNLLSLSRGGETFAQLGGMESLKDFCRRALRTKSKHQARGALLLSPPGCGKSSFCRALGHEVGRPVLSLDLGKVMGSLVGESERNIRQALQIAEAMAPSILFVDEIEKGLSGVNASGDSGVSTRLFGNLLTWLSDHVSDVFFIATANDIRRMPPEFTRAERLDGVFFVDLPTAEQRQAIWSLYRDVYQIPADDITPTDHDWTGAEIKSCCRLSALLGIPLSAAAQNVVPVSITSAESIDQLRIWASGRCLSADQSAIYQRTTSSSKRRKVSTTPSTN
ncbi:AAA family ATPase [Schlesneria paludicola]|uniref:AAA family ATPase n=1 Tax=Schlesneria paludicola TaxID=360056 RepID=UPI00029B01AA|nr:AAA family ATPase [Schlesneria paludicola]